MTVCTARQRSRLSSLIPPFSTSSPRAAARRIRSGGRASPSRWLFPERTLQARLATSSRVTHRRVVSVTSLDSLARVGRRPTHRVRHHTSLLVAESGTELVLGHGPRPRGPPLPEDGDQQGEQQPRDESCEAVLAQACELVVTGHRRLLHHDEVGGALAQLRDLVAVLLTDGLLLYLQDGELGGCISGRLAELRDVALTGALSRAQCRLSGVHRLLCRRHLVADVGVLGERVIGS